MILHYFSTKCFICLNEWVIINDGSLGDEEYEYQKAWIQADKANHRMVHIQEQFYGQSKRSGY